MFVHEATLDELNRETLKRVQCTTSAPNMQCALVHVNGTWNTRAPLRIGNVATAWSETVLSVVPTNTKQLFGAACRFFLIETRMHLWQRALDTNIVIYWLPTIREGASRRRTKWVVVRAPPTIRRSAPPSGVYLMAPIHVEQICATSVFVQSFWACLARFV